LRGQKSKKDISLLLGKTYLFACFLRRIWVSILYGKCIVNSFQNLWRVRIFLCGRVPSTLVGHKHHRNVLWHAHKFLRAATHMAICIYAQITPAPQQKKDGTLIPLFHTVKTNVRALDNKFKMSTDYVLRDFVATLLCYLWFVWHKAK